MGYTAYLQKLLQPLGVYDFREDGPSGGELTALGEAMDFFFAHAQTLQQESLPLTASGEGISLWESLLPYPAAGDLEARRQRILGLCSLGGKTLTAQALGEAITACGVKCLVTEDAASKTAIVTFPNCLGYPEQYENKRAVIEGILPCHLNVRYDIRWITWQDTEAKDLTWQDLREKTFLQWSLAKI